MTTGVGVSKHEGGSGSRRTRPSSGARPLDPERISEDLLAFCDNFGISLFRWQREAFGAACRRVNAKFVHRLAVVSVPRSVGKSFAGACVGLWRLITGPAPQDILSAALDTEGAKVLLDHAKAIIRSTPALTKAIDIRAGELLVPSTGSRWTITSREHTASRGRHPTLVLLDEVGWARDDEQFASLVASQASVEDAFCLLVSTVGRRKAGPLWTVKQLAEGGDPGTFWYWSGDATLSPKITKAPLERQRKILMPGQFAREVQNAWIDAATSYCASEDVECCMATEWREQHRGIPGAEYVAYLDIGLTHDPSVCAVGHRDADGTIVIDTIRTFRGSKQRPVRISTLRECLVDLAQRFPGLNRIFVESWQGVALAEELTRLSLPVEVLHPTPKLLQDQWGLFAQALAAGQFVCFPHADLRTELLNLSVEVGPQGARVVDRGQVHQDHAVACRGVVAALAQGASEFYVAASGLSARPTCVNLSASPDDEAAQYAAEQRRWELEARRRELAPGGGPFDAEVSPYGSGRRRGMWEDF